MILKFMNRTWEIASRFNLILVASNLILSVVTAMSVHHALSAKPIVRLVPPYLDHAVTIGWQSASADYLKSVGLHFVTLAANVHPHNVQFVADTLSMFVASNIYPDVRKKLLALAAEPTFKDSGGAVLFLPDTVVDEPATQKVFVTGQMVISTAGGQRTNRPVVYEMKIEMRDGRPWITSLDSYEGTNPRTQKWLAANPELAKQYSTNEAAQ